MVNVPGNSCFLLTFHSQFICLLNDKFIKLTKPCRYCLAFVCAPCCVVTGFFILINKLPFFNAIPYAFLRLFRVFCLVICCSPQSFISIFLIIVARIFIVILSFCFSLFCGYFFAIITATTFVADQAKINAAIDARYAGKEKTQPLRFCIISADYLHCYSPVENPPFGGLVVQKGMS